MTYRLGSLAVVAIAVLAAGCGTQTGQTAATSAKPTHEVPAEPSTTPTTTASTHASSATPAVVERPSALKARLLPAETLPGFTRTFGWRTASTTAVEGADLAGTCHRFAMTSAGAWKVVRRTYAPAVASPSSGSELVAQFPDVKTAKRVYAVLTSWHDKCAEQLTGNPTIGDLVTVPLGTATGGWYLLTYGSTLDAQGIVRNGDRIAVLMLRTEGKSYRYPAGKEPMVTALKRASELL
jgi:hypothetical protein